MSEIDFVCSNFLCQNVQTSIGGGGVQTHSERPNFSRPNHSRGGGFIRASNNVQSFLIFFLWLSLFNQYVFNYKPITGYVTKLVTVEKGNPVYDYSPKGTWVAVVVVEIVIISSTHVPK